MVLPLLIPLAAAAVGAGASAYGASQASSSSKRAALINAWQQAQVNAQNQQAQAMANAVQQSQWNKSFAASQSAYRQSRVDARNLLNVELREARNDRALQKEFAQQGVQWRAQDARKAGIHPLAAMGAQLAQASPISVGGSVPSASFPGASSPGVTPNVASQYNPVDYMPQAMASMGQDISRAIVATQTQYQREQEMNSASSLLSLENQSLQNQLLQAQIARISGAGVGPPMPSSTTKMTPVEYNAGVGPNASQEGVSNPDLSYGRTASGYSVENPKILAETGEDDVFSQVSRAIRNRVLPTFGINQNPPAHIPLEKDEYWYFNWLRQEYQKRRYGPPIDARNFNWGY